MTTNLHSREKDKRSKAPHHPGDKVLAGLHGLP